MIIIRQKSFSEKKEKNKEKAILGKEDAKVLGATGAALLGSKHLQDKAEILEELGAYKSAAKYEKRAGRLGLAALAIPAAGYLYYGYKKAKKEKAYSGNLEQKEFGKVKAANKAAKKAWEKLNQDTVLVGSPTVRQFRKINASGLTLTKHELKGNIGTPIRNHEGKRVAEINLRPDKPVNHSINTKGINEHLHRDISYSPKSIMRTFQNDPKKGEFTRVRWDLAE